MTERVMLEIRGFGCGGGGALTVERTLARLRGVIRADVNPATEVAYVEYDPELVGPADLVQVVRELGYGAGEPRRR